VSLDPSNPVFDLCIQGTRAEFTGQPMAAAEHYRRAWKQASDDLEACVAAHYLARFQPTPAEALRWNQQALARAQPPWPPETGWRGRFSPRCTSAWARHTSRPAAAKKPAGITTWPRTLAIRIRRDELRESARPVRMNVHCGTAPVLLY
jgi:hypothetical protein